jgi:hypothetical protein
MKKKNMLLSFVGFLFSCTCMLGANYVVQVGEKIQDKVAGASSGDAVIIRGGTFPEQGVTITQPMRLVREKGQNVIIGGTITLDGVSGDIVLRDFAIDVNGNGKLVIKDCTKVGLEDLTDLPQGVEISNSTVIMRSCQLGNLTITGNSDVQVIDSTLANLTTTGSKVQAVDSTMAVLTATDSNLTLAKSTHTTGSITRGQTLYHGSTANSDVTINASDWRAHGSTFKGNLTSTNAHSKLLKTMVNEEFSHQGATKDCVVFQSTVGRTSGDVLYSDANRTWVTYSEVHHFVQNGGVEAHLNKNKFLTDKQKGNVAILMVGSNCILQVNNNTFWSTNASFTPVTGQIDVRQVHRESSAFGVVKTLYPHCPVSKVTNLIHQSSSNSHSTECIMRFYYSDGTTADSNKNTQVHNWSSTKTYNNPNASKFVIKIEVLLRATTVSYSYYRAHEKDTRVYTLGNVNGVHDGISVAQAKKVAIHNNLFRRWDEYGHCISIGNTPTNGTSIHGNAFWRDAGTWRKHAVNAPVGGECSHNFFHSANTAHTVTGGIAHFDNILGGDPKINIPSYSLNAGSPLINAGPEEPQFNDHDGSRNDIGMFGGHAYDPAGTTSVNPVVLSGTQNIVRMNVGDTTPIVIKARAAVSTPNQ